MDVPTTVELSNGTVYTIPTGAWGTFAWVRQANLLAVAYRQVQNGEEAERWEREYDRRRAVWELLEAGRDQASVVAQFGKDLLLAPFRIAADIGREALDVAGKVKETGFGLLGILTNPLFLVLILAGAVLILTPAGPKLARSLGLK